MSALESALDDVRAAGGITRNDVTEVSGVGPFAIPRRPGASFMLIQAKEWDDL